MIDLTNYEDYLLRLVDHELTAAERDELDAFLESHPALRGELALLEATRLDPAQAVAFPDRASLYRHQGVSRRRITPVRWRAAAAAAVLLAAGAYLWMRTGPRPGAGNAVPAFAVTAPGSRASGDGGSGGTAGAATPAVAPVAPARDSGTRVTPAPRPSAAAGTRLAAGSPAKHATTPLPPEGQPASSRPGGGQITPLPPVTAAVQMPAGPQVPPPGVEGTPPAGSIPAEAAVSNGSVAGRLESGKRELDQSITEGIDALQQKKAALISSLSKKEIRIGRFTLALNQ